MGFRRATHVAWRRVGDETVLLHLKTKRIFVLNPSAGFFWHRLDGTRRAEDLLSSVSLDEPLPADATSSVASFLDGLAEADLVEATEGPRAVETAPDEPPEFPLSEFVPPELVWEEQLRNFGQSCARMPGQFPTCDAAPTT